MESVLEFARHYIALGIKCHPIAMGMKKPRNSEWPTRFLTIEKFCEHYQEGDGLGVVTGKASGLVTIDIDVRATVSGLTWYEANKDNLGNYILEETGGNGLHLHFNYPPHVDYIKSGRIAPGVEIYADGGKQVVTAPSIHSSGNRYNIKHGMDLTDVMFEADYVPDWLIEIANKTHVIEKPKTNGVHYANGVEYARGAIERMAGAIQGEGGDARTFEAACRCRDYGLTETQAYMVLLESFNPRCSPPWSEAELLLKVQNAYKYANGILGSATPAAQFNIETPLTAECVESGGEKKHLYTKTNIFDFIEKDYPPKQHIIGPFVKQGLSMVYAPRGVGKTYFAISLAFAVATGGRFLNWQAEHKQSVIYLDGELPAHLLIDRFRALIKQNNIVGRCDFNVMTPDEQKAPMPDLSTKAGQDVALEIIGDSEFIIIDNISTLCRTGDENKAEDWIPVQSWLLKLRTMGKSVLLIHHSGKSAGVQRGTSKREDVLDLVISLSHPAGYKHEEGCKFEVKFSKSRHFRRQNDITEVVAELTDFGWRVENLEDNLLELIRNMYCSLGMKQKDIAEELNLSKGYVSKLVKKIDLEKEYNS